MPSFLKTVRCYNVNITAHAKKKGGSVADEVHEVTTMQPLFKGSVKNMGRVRTEFKNPPPINALLQKGCCKVGASAGGSAC